MRKSTSKAFSSLVSNLTTSYGAEANRIAVSVDATEVLLPINVAVPCGLVLNELISNALKHAFPHGRAGEVMVSLRKESDEQVVLCVSDNGVGIPDDLHIAETATLGLQLVWLLADQLRAEVTVQRSNPTRFELRLPLGPQ